MPSTAEYMLALAHIMFHWLSRAYHKMVSVKLIHGTFLASLGHLPPKCEIVSGTDLLPCAKFQRNTFSNFGDAFRTDRQQT